MYKILLQQFIKQFGRVPSALEKILLKQKATRIPSGQHALDKEYYKRIEAVQFTMSHDDGKIVNDLDEAQKLKESAQKKLDDLVNNVGNFEGGYQAYAKK